MAPAHKPAMAPPTTHELRHPSGMPAGGQYAPRNRRESTIGLTDPETYEPTTHHPDSGLWQIIDPTIAETVQLGTFTRTTAAPGGVPHIRARTTAAAALIGGATAEAVELAEAGGPFAVLTVTPTGTVHIREGVGFIRDDELILRTHDKGGWQLHTLNVLAAAAGADSRSRLTETFNDAIRKVPATIASHFDGIPEHIPGQEPEERFSAAYLVDGPPAALSLAGTPVAGCVFLATSIETDDGIVHGFLWAPDGSGIQAEETTMRTRELATRGGRLADFTPGSLTLSKAVDGRLGGERAAAYDALTKPARIRA